MKKTIVLGLSMLALANIAQAMEKDLSQARSEPLPLTRAIKPAIAKVLYDHPYLSVFSGISLFTLSSAWLNSEPNSNNRVNMNSKALPKVTPFRIFASACVISLPYYFGGMLLKSSTHKTLRENKVPHSHDGLIFHYTDLEHQCAKDSKTS